MFPTAILAAVLNPVLSTAPGDWFLPTHTVEGAAIQIPVELDRLREQSPEANEVQLFVSSDRGSTWKPGSMKSVADLRQNNMLYYQAAKPGEYWFAVRVRRSDGSVSPTDPADFSPLLIVNFVRRGVAGGPAEQVPGLEDELDRVEIDLIRREVRRLAAAKEGTIGALGEVDQLRDRLRRLRARGQERSPTVTRAGSKLSEVPLPQIPVAPR